ncbi:MAG TPA: hypothetical protein VK828_09515 [Terriglobales bacterium]|jgi:hypothetical protein|nr:hypothetical protein [Terriglobales bacterium]
MSSLGTGSTITPDVAMDLLHKLITESINVQASFGSGAGVTAAVVGVVKVGPDGAVAVMPKRATPGSAFLSFTPSEVVLWKYGDDRILPNKGATLPDGPTFSSALCCVLRDGSQFAIFEIRDK